MTDAPTFTHVLENVSGVEIADAIDSNSPLTAMCGTAWVPQLGPDNDLPVCNGCYHALLASMLAYRDAVKSVGLKLAGLYHD